jgi:hypothetical protein
VREIEDERDSAHDELNKLRSNSAEPKRANTGPSTPGGWLAYCELFLQMDRGLTKRDLRLAGTLEQHQSCVDFKKQFKADCVKAYGERNNLWLAITPDCKRWRPAGYVGAD